MIRNIEPVTYFTSLESMPASLGLALRFPLACNLCGAVYRHILEMSGCMRIAWLAFWFLPYQQNYQQSSMASPCCSEHASTTKNQSSSPPTRPDSSTQPRSIIGYDVFENIITLAIGEHINFDTEPLLSIRDCIPLAEQVHRRGNNAQE